MSELWYKKIGFYDNPFSIKPGMYDDELIAYDLSSVYKKIEKGEMLFIEGQYGSGKTTILKNIIANFKGRNKIIYYSFNTGEQIFNLNGLLDGANSLLRKISGLKVKNMIMLLDEVHTMKSGDAKKLIKPFKEGIIKSIVFVSHDFEMVDFPEEIRTTLNENVIRTVSLSVQEAIALVRKRIGKLDFLPDKMIAKIFMLAEKNPRRLLEYCEDVMKYTIEIGDDKVTDYHINEVLGDLLKQKKRKFNTARKQEKKTEEKEEKILEEEIEVKEEIKKPKVKKAVKATPKKPVVKEQKKEEKPVEMPVIEKKEEELIKVEIEDDKSKEKKFKINKLVGDDTKNSLGTIAEKEEEIIEEEPEKKKSDEEVPEYKIYFVDE